MFEQIFYNNTVFKVDELNIRVRLKNNNSINIIIKEYDDDNNRIQIEKQGIAIVEIIEIFNSMIKTWFEKAQRKSGYKESNFHNVEIIF